MEIKIQCSCGMRYKFDVEPVNGRVPTPLACPNCHASWTEHANAMIAQSLGLPAPAADPVAVVATPVASMAVATPKMALRLGGQAAAEPAAASGASRGEEQAAPAPTVRHVPYVPTLNPVLEQHDMGGFGLGFLGAFGGALLGGIVYYLLFVHTGIRLKLIALGVGFLAGTGARLLGKDRSKELGAIGALVAVGMIMGAQYLVAWKWFHEGDTGEASATEKSGYEAQVEEAGKVVAAVPNGTDQEIRLYLAKEQADDGEKPDLKSVEAEEIKEFKEVDLPYARKLADGTFSKEDFDKEHTVAMSAEDRQKEKEDGERVFKWVFLAFVMSKFNIVCVIGAAGIAYKMIADA
jgi:hypothetical protein